MKCSDIEELISAYANGELSRMQREFVEEHLPMCANCRATLADYAAVRHHLISLRVTPVFADVREGTMSKIRAEGVSSREPIGRWMRLALVALPIVAILIALLALPPGALFLDPTV